MSLYSDSREFKMWTMKLLKVLHSASTAKGCRGVKERGTEEPEAVS